MAIKKIEFDSVNRSEIIKEYLSYLIINKLTRGSSLYLVEHYDAWFEENLSGNLVLHIKMALFKKTLADVISESIDNSDMRTEGSLTKIGYYMTSQLFIKLLKCVEFLHNHNPPIIHRDLKPDNILIRLDSSMRGK